MTLVGRLTFAASIAFVLVIRADAALAQSGGEGDDSDLQRAVVLFEESETLYNQGQFSEAAALLRRAYELHEDPTLLFNLGRALEGMGDLEGAIEAYGRYLQDAPEAEDAGAVARRLETLRNQRDAMDDRPDRFVDEPFEDGDGDQDDGGGSLFLPPWLIAGGGVVLIGVGAVFGVSSQGKADDAAAEPVQTTANELHSDAEGLATLANVFYVLGGLTLAGGVAWGVLTLGGDDEESVDAALLPGGVAISGRF